MTYSSSITHSHITCKVRVKAVLRVLLRYLVVVGLRPLILNEVTQVQCL